jgi:hypothetical protein
MREALEFLGITPPKVSKGQTQADVDAMVEAWKETTLADHFKQVRRDAHPDLHGSSEEATQKFKDLTTAYDEVKTNLKLRIPPERVLTCRSCKAARTPENAAHCHECGLRYEAKEERPTCPLCSSARTPNTAKFCHACGYDYHVIDPLIERLRLVGFTRSDIAGLETDGTIDQWRSLSPFSKDLGDAIHITFQTRKIRRGGKGDFGSLFRGV